MLLHQFPHCEVFIYCVYYVIHATTRFEAEYLLACWVFEQQLTCRWTCAAGAAAAAAVRSRQQWQ
jgi:hypothetical protein